MSDGKDAEGAGSTRKIRGVPPWSAAVLVLVLVAFAHAPALRGGFVWDDHALIAENPRLSDPVALWTGDIAGGDLPDDVPLHRPVVMTSFAIVQALAPGPAAEHLVNLALFGVLLAAFARLAVHLGAPTTHAWAGALLLGVHPLVVESVAWISGRHELLPATLTLVAWSLLPRRPWLAGAILAATPFAKESWLVIPVATLLLHPLLGPAVRVPAAVSALGVVGSLVLRAVLGEGLPVAEAFAPLAALGGIVARGLTLLVVPTVSGPVPALREVPALGVAALLLGPVLILGARGLPALAPLAATGVFLAPAAVAAARFGLASDRYFLLPAVGAALSGVLLLRARPLAPVAAIAAAVLLVPLTRARAAEWTSDLALFEAAHARDPASPDASFYLGAALQDAHRCDEALPLLRAADTRDPRAGPRLQICLVETGRHAEAIEMAPRLDGATAAMTTARARALTGDLAGAASDARRATELLPRSPRAWTLLGNLLGQQGRLAEADAAFLTALALDPAQPEALAGRDAVRRRLDAGTGPAPSPVPPGTLTP